MNQNISRSIRFLAAVVCAIFLCALLQTGNRGQASAQLTPNTESESAEPETELPNSRPDIHTGPQIVVLTNGHNLFGTVSVFEEKATIETEEGSRLVMPFDQIAFTCKSMEEAYWLRLSRVKASDIEGQVGLYRWCLRNDLTKLAANQLDILAGLDLPTSRLEILIRQLAVSMEPESKIKLTTDAETQLAETQLAETQLAETQLAETQSPTRFDRQHADQQAQHQLGPAPNQLQPSGIPVDESFEFQSLPEVDSQLAQSNLARSNVANEYVANEYVANEYVANEYDIRPLPPIYRPVVESQYADTGVPDFPTRNSNDAMNDRDDLGGPVDGDHIADRAGEPLVPRLPQASSNGDRSTVSAEKFQNQSGTSDEIAQVGFQEDLPRGHNGQTVAANSSRAADAYMPSIDELEQLTKSLPRPAVAFYKRKIEPAMVRSCYTAGCHDSEAGTMPLLRINRSSTVPRGMSQRNLYNIIKFTDANQPLSSTLLSRAGTPHGMDVGIGEAGQAGRNDERFFERDSVQFNNLATWLIMISHNPYGNHVMPVPDSFTLQGAVGSTQLPRGPASQVSPATFIEESPLDAAQNFDSDFSNGVVQAGGGINLPNETKRGLSLRAALKAADPGTDRIELSPALDPLALIPEDDVDSSPAIDPENTDPHSADIFNSQFGANK